VDHTRCHAASTASGAARTAWIYGRLRSLKSSVSNCSSSSERLKERRDGNAREARTAVISELVLGRRDALGAQVHLRRGAVVRRVVEHEHEDLEAGHAVERLIGLRDLRRRQLRDHGDRLVERLIDAGFDGFGLPSVNGARRFA